MTSSWLQKTEVEDSVHVVWGGVENLGSSTGSSDASANAAAGNADSELFVRGGYAPSSAAASPAVAPTAAPASASSAHPPLFAQAEQPEAQAKSGGMRAGLSLWSGAHERNGMNEVEFVNAVGTSTDSSGDDTLRPITDDVPADAQVPQENAAAPVPAAIGACPNSTAIERMGGSWSVGSEGHAAATCKPCAWVWRPGGCANATECWFCHLCEDGTIQRIRKDRLKQVKARRRAERQSQDSSGYDGELKGERIIL
eukprot:TRINITY_DN1565_c0_g2_i1.p1 TRINITY_DN1565_c0_g2~~TRINITY_DN1565_c0_g2_i1.p1  ORF type:complete len:255 (+),score=38.26 TRINITY_DN1565_c0_g2_i1:100-864(+)